MPHRLALVLSITLSACAPTSELAVEIDVTDVPEATDVRAELRAADCSGPLVPGSEREAQRGGSFASWRVGTGSYGVSVVAVDGACRVVASVCVATPTDRRSPLVLRPERDAAPARECTLARCRTGCMGGDAGDLDGGTIDGGTLDGGALDTPAIDAPAVDAPPAPDTPVEPECTIDRDCRSIVDCIAGECVGGLCTNFSDIPGCVPR